MFNYSYTNILATTPTGVSCPWVSEAAVELTLLSGSTEGILRELEAASSSHLRTKILAIQK